MKNKLLVHVKTVINLAWSKVQRGQTLFLVTVLFADSNYVLVRDVVWKHLAPLWLIAAKMQIRRSGAAGKGGYRFQPTFFYFLLKVCCVPCVNHFLHLPLRPGVIMCSR